MSFVPAEWTDMVARLREAQVAGDIMRNPDTAPAARDQATDAYCRAVDAVIADLGVLQEQQVLGRITLFLARKER